MLVVPAELRPSPIHGIGVFLLTPVKKGALIWRFDSRIDRVYSQDELENLPAPLRKFTETYAMWHKPSNLWVICGDYACYMNHSETPNTLSMGAVFADDVAACDLAAGVELTTDYRVICDSTLETGTLSTIV